MGSNTMPEENLELARKLLKERYPDIIFGQKRTTTPLFFTANRNKFQNQLGLFYSDWSAEKLESYCKQIEAKAGRTSEDKSEEIVKLDIDLLMIDNEVLKTKDMQRQYIRKGMKELGIGEADTVVIQ